MPSCHETVGMPLDLHGVQHDAGLGKHALEPVVKILEDGVVLAVLPVRLVDDEKDVARRCRWC